MRIAVVGAGYVGCVTAACLSRDGHDIVAIDVDPGKVQALRRGTCPIVEPGLDELVAENVRSGRLRAEESSVKAFASMDAAIVCVSTPSMADGSIDLRPMMRVFSMLAEAAETLGSPHLVLVRSTIAPGVLRRVLERHRAAPLNVVVNPEFLRETAAIQDFDRPPFLVFGGDHQEAAHAASEIFARVPGPRYFLSLESALLLKYASNAFHGMKIAFANQIASLCEATGASPLDVMRVFCEDTSLNISRAYLRPGFAFGGSCLPKDIRALVSIGRSAGIHMPLLEGVLNANYLRIVQVANEIVKAKPNRVTMLGLSFKNGTDDLRESPYLLLAERLLAEGLQLRIYDPDVLPDRVIGKNRDYLEQHLPDVDSVLTGELSEALLDSDTVVLCKPVRSKDELLRVTSGKTVFDLEYLLERPEGPPSPTSVTTAHEHPKHPHPDPVFSA
jgi:GDP-mannose 6-dehydrogenase